MAHRLSNRRHSINTARENPDMPGIRRTFLPALLSMSLCPLLAGCIAASSESADSGDRYDADSWETLIADDCRAYFDGCNSCRRAAGSALAACTRKACA